MKNKLLYGNYGIYATKHCLLNKKFIEVAQFNISKSLPKKARV